MPKKIIIKEEQMGFLTPLDESISNEFNEMGLLDEEELLEYAWLKKENTGIDIDIFVDDGGSYKRYGHPLWIYARNGHTDNDPFFHIIVSNKPELPNIDYNISSFELRAITAFVEINANLLRMLADDEISHLEFYKMCRPIIHSFSKSETKSVNEMATLKPNVSGLPMILWIDEGTSPQHGPRVKFKANSDQKTTSSYSTMTISQNPKVRYLPNKCDLTTRDIEVLKEFIRINEKLLLSLCRKEITYQDFLINMVKV